MSKTSDNKRADNDKPAEAADKNGTSHTASQKALPQSPLGQHRSRMLAAMDAGTAPGGGTPLPPPPPNPTGSTTPATPPSLPVATTPVEQSVQFTNSESAAYAPAIIATPADAMISQATGLAAQSSANYYDGMTKMVMASQGVMLKKLTEDLGEGNIMGSIEEAAGILVTEVLLAGAMAVAAAGGAMESASAAFAIGQINDSVKNLKDSLPTGSGGEKTSPQQKA